MAQAEPSVEVRGPRWLPRVVSEPRSLADAAFARRYVEGGLRVDLDASGGATTAEELLPAGARITFLELPQRLGSGFVFFSFSEGTAAYKAATWTAPLVPLTRFEGKVEVALAGFEGVLIKTDTWWSLSLDTGALTRPLSLPVAPYYEQVAVVDGWFGGVLTPLIGLQVTFDAGQSWQAAPIAEARALGAEGTRLVFEGPSSRFYLDASGRLEAGQAVTGPLVIEDEGDGEAPVVFTERRSPWSEPSPLEQALIGGYLAKDGSFVAAQRGALLRLDPGTGQVQERVEAQLVDADCGSVELGKGWGFVCTGHGQTRIYEASPALRASLVQRFFGLRSVAASGTGALTISGPCAGAPQSHRLYCVRTPAGELREVEVDSEAAQVIGLKDGRIAVLSPPVSGSPTLELRAPGERPKKVPVAFTQVPKGSRRLLEQGVWLRGFREGPEGLSGWVMDGSAVVGVRVRWDGGLEAGGFVQHAESAVLSGRYGWVPVAPGKALATTDFGRSFREELVPLDATSWQRQATLRAGCGQLGCVLGPWLRVGWQGSERGQLAQAPAPRWQSLPSPGGARWMLNCEGPTSESPRALVPPRQTSPALSRRRPSVLGSVEGAEGGWQPFWHLLPPKKGKARLRLMAASEPEETHVAGYLWSLGEWDKGALFQFYAVDRFRVEQGAWMGAESPAPWQKEVLARKAFGFEGSTVHWSAELDASGEAGVLLIRAGTETELHWFGAERRSLSVLGPSTELVPRLSGMAQLKARAFVGSATTRRFAVAEVTQEGLLPRLSVPLDRAGLALNPRLVRNVEQDRLAVWATGPQGGWFVYPIDLEAGAFREVIEVSARELSRTPPYCGHDQDGWLLVGPIQPAPRLDIAGIPADFRLGPADMRLVLRRDGLCLDALSARVETESLSLPGPRPGAGVEPGTPLAVRDLRAGRRWGFSCRPEASPGRGLP